jgi:hypothetical protein
VWGAEAEHLDSTLVEQCLAFASEDHWVIVPMQVLLCQVVGWDCQEPLVRQNSSCLALVVPSKRTHRSILFELVEAEHSVDHHWAAVLPCHEMVVLVLLVHLADHCDHRIQCLFVVAQAWEGHRQASHENRPHIVRVDQAENDYVGLVADTDAEVEHLPY